MSATVLDADFTEPISMTKRKGGKTPARPAQRGISAAKLTDMIEAATVDAYDESEQATGWFTMFEEHLELPFDTGVLSLLDECRRRNPLALLGGTNRRLPARRHDEQVQSAGTGGSPRVVKANM